jgi:tetratricopeptide (TPR) repeat protein
VADVHRLLGNAKDALAAYDRAVEELRVLADGDKGGVSELRELATALNNRGVLRFQLGGTDARADFREALRRWERLSGNTPEDPDLTARLAATQSNLGVLLTTNGEYEEAAERLAVSLRLRRALVEDHPDAMNYREALAESFVSLGNLECEQVNWKDAAAYFRNAAEEARRMLDDRHENPAAQSLLATSNNNLASVLKASGQTDEAREIYRNSVRLLDELVVAYPSVSAYRELRATAQLNLAMLLSERPGAPESAGSIREALAAFEALDRASAVNPQVRQGTALGLQQLALQMADSGRQQEAELTLLRAIDLQRQLVRQFPQYAEPKSLLGVFYESAAELLRRRSDWNDSASYIQRAIETQETAMDLAPKSIAYRVRLRDHYALQSEILLQQGETADAAVAASRMASVLPEDWQQDLKAADLLARCIPLATALKGQGRIGGKTVDEFCKTRCVELLRAGIEHGATSYEQLMAQPVYQAIEDQDALDTLKEAEREH